MSNENEAMNPQGGDIEKMQQYFKQLKNPNQGEKSNQLKGAELLKKMFVPTNPTEIFRILPVKNVTDVTTEAYFHVIKVQTSKGTQWKKIYCPKHNDGLKEKTNSNGEVERDQEGKPVMVKHTCPLCEKSEYFLSQQDKSLIGTKKEDMTQEQLAIKAKNDELWTKGVYWQAKKFHIVKGIDRGVEKDGVKFWRFKDNRKHQGVLDKLIPALSDYMSYSKKLFYDVDGGCDISITMSDVPMPNNPSRTYKDVSSINNRGTVPLSNDPIIRDQWLNDKTTWRDVFRKPNAPNVTTEELYELIAEGNMPYWDDSNQNDKKWVFPGHPELQTKANTRDLNLDADKNKQASAPQQQESISNMSSTTQPIQNNVQEPNVVNMGSDFGDNDFDDLPF